MRRFVVEFVVSDVKESVKKLPKKDNNLYKVEIKEVDRQDKRIRIHFKGCDARFDEWRPYDQDGEYRKYIFVRWEKPHVLTSLSLNDRADYFIDMLFRGIKRNLNSKRKDDPNVRIEIDVTEDVFNHVFGAIPHAVEERGRLVCSVSSNRMLDTTVGPKWDERIINIRGDFCFVVEGTVKF